MPVLVFNQSNLIVSLDIMDEGRYVEMLFKW